MNYKNLLLHFLIVAVSAAATAGAQYLSGVNLGIAGPIVVASLTTIAHYLSGLLDNAPQA